jgi:hypothetical protein
VFFALPRSLPLLLPCLLARPLFLLVPTLSGLRHRFYAPARCGPSSLRYLVSSDRCSCRSLLLLPARSALALFALPACSCRSLRLSFWSFRVALVAAVNAVSLLSQTSRTRPAGPSGRIVRMTCRGECSPLGLGTEYIRLKEAPCLSTLRRRWGWQGTRQGGLGWKVSKFFFDGADGVG